MGELIPDQGKVSRGTKIELIYFDQLREQLEPEKSVIDNLAEGREYIEINGKRRHVISYLQDFLFPPERARQPVKSLSGGEQNRLILARLFSKPANLIVLDEPTNDLDMETLELLEEILLDYKGTLLLVSHDRLFLDNVITSSLVFENAGAVKEYVGGYSDWTRNGGQFEAFKSKSSYSESKALQAKKSVTKPAGVRRENPYGYKEQRELKALPEKIEKWEKNIVELESVIAEEGFYQQDHKAIDKQLTQLANYQSELEVLYTRWVELEQLQGL